ncbi:MAG: hypothetical protein WBQ34_09660 [Candidatus Acidiferrales bacterium]
MCRPSQVWWPAVLLLAIGGLSGIARAQSAGSQPDYRLFPQVGPDLKAIKRDSAGRYYILAKPASVVWVYGPDGKLTGTIPNVRSAGAVIRYAVDIDVDSAGDLFVADRGANAIEIFRPDGSFVKKVPVFAPVSVVALPGAQFAVVSLRSKYLVSIYDHSGNVYDQFGDRSELNPGASPDTLLDPGKIYGDGAGHIYFAFTSMPDPMVRKYDRVGYMDFAAQLPVSQTGQTSSKPEDRVEFGLNVGQMNFSDQVGAWATLGTSGTLRFGSSMGTGFGERMRGGFARGAQNFSAGGFGNPMALGTANALGTPGTQGLNGATFFGQGMLQHGHFHFDLGAGLGRGRFGRNSGADSDDATDVGQASLLQFDSGELSDNSGISGGGDSNDNTDTEILDSDTTSDLTSPDAALGDEQADSAFETPFANTGLQPGMFAGGMLFRPHGGGFGGHGGGGGFAGRGLGGVGFGGASRPPGGEAAGGVAPNGGRPPFGPGGHFVFNTLNVAATVRVNLDRPTQRREEKPTLTAVGIDPATGESWAAVGSQLIHLGKDGSLLGTYYISTPDGTPLYPDAILVEPDRLLLADDPLGIFSFARPDRNPASPEMNVAAQATRPSGAR